jgi:HD-like signal output (HDOD) protein
MTDLTTAEAEKIIASVAIPPRPCYRLTLILAERGKSDPTCAASPSMVSTDVGLAAAVLKTINSPFFGLRRQVTSIDAWRQHARA